MRLLSAALNFTPRSIPIILLSLTAALLFVLYFSMSSDMMANSNYLEKNMVPVKKFKVTESGTKLDPISDSVAVIRNAKPPTTGRRKLCQTYEELRYVPFDDNRITPYICKGVTLYEPSASGGYPACSLQTGNEVMNELLRITKQRSILTYLNGPKRGSRYPMYTFGHEDDMSRIVMDLHNWENLHIKKLVLFAKSMPDTTFIDIGSNLGMYTLYAANENLPTISLDANIRNLLRLRLSFDANGHSADKTILLWNLLGTERNAAPMALSLPALCSSGIIGIGKNKYLANNSVPDTIKVMPMLSSELAKFIKTRNVVMKIDIEGREHEFFETLGTVLDDFNIPVVAIELLVKKANAIEYLTNKNYVPYTREEGKLLDIKLWKSWPENSVWIKKSYVDQALAIFSKA